MPKIDAVDDQTISATVKALAAAWDWSLDSVALQIQMTPRTFYRRMKDGHWTAGEVSRLSVLFRTSREALYTGEVRITPPSGGGDPGGEVVGRVGLEPTPGGL